MIADLEMERLYARVHLVRGKGERRSGALCIMSFVALLAGERHTDAPSTASPLLRQFALVLNDAMPEPERQRLKPFAPRIIGTADGFDPGRAAVLRHAMQKVVFPRVCSDIQQDVLPSGPLHDPCGVSTAHPAKELFCSFSVIAAADDTPRNQRQLALLAARLLCACAAAATGVTARAWYWSQAIDLLDRLCEVGMPRTRPALSQARVEKLLSGNALAAGGVRRVVATLRRLGHALAGRIGSAPVLAEAPAPGIATTVLPPSATDAVRNKIVLPGA